MDDVVGFLQEAVFDESRWLSLADSIDGACGLIGNQLSVTSATEDLDMDCLFQQALIRGQPQKDLEVEYLERHAPRDERIPRMNVMPLGKAHHNTELWTESERKRSSMYRSFLPRVCSNDQVIVRMRGRGDTTIFWTLSREMDGGGWSFENVERIERLVPHVAHFVQVQQALAAADARGDALAALLDRTGLVYFISTAAAGCWKRMGGRGVCWRRPIALPRGKVSSALAHDARISTWVVC